MTTTNKYIARSKLVATQRNLSSALGSRFATPQTTQPAARVTGSVVAINGRFYQGSIADDTASVVNSGRLAAPVYTAAGGGSAVTIVRGGGNSSGGGSGSVGVHDLNGPEHTGALPWTRLNFTGSTIGSIQTRTHSLLTGLTSSDDHTQYVHNTSARTITAQHTFNPATAGAPFTLGANALTQLVSGLNAQYVGGLPESTFMRKSANSNLSMNSFVITSNDVNNAYSLGHMVISSSSAGSTWTGLRSRALSSAAGNAMILQSDGGQTVVNAAPGQNISFRNNNTALATLDASDYIFSSPLTLKSSNYASQTTGWGITYDGAGDFRYLYADELHAKAFIADLEQALAGGQIISKSVAILSRDFTAPAAGGTATLYVKDLPSASNMAVFVSGDYVRLRQFSRASGSLSITNCWGVVTSYSDLSGGEQSWTFTRSSGADAGAMSSGHVVDADSIVLDYGTTGNGFYEVNAIDGLYAVNSPYMQIVTWDTHPRSGQTVRVRVGNLTGVGFTGEYGLYAAGGASGAQYLKASDDSFILAGGPAGSTTIDENGVNIEVGTSFDNDEAYTFSASGTQLGGFWMYQNVNIVGLQLGTHSVTNNDSIVYINSDANGTGKYADAYMLSRHNTRTNDPAMLRFKADETESVITAYGERFEMDATNGVCFAEPDDIVTGYINIYMGGTGHLYARFPNGTIVELAAD